MGFRIWLFTNLEHQCLPGCWDWWCDINKGFGSLAVGGMNNFYWGLGRGQGEKKVVAAWHQVSHPDPAGWGMSFRIRMRENDYRKDTVLCHWISFKCPRHKLDVFSLCYYGVICLKIEYIISSMVWEFCRYNTLLQVFIFNGWIKMFWGTF